MGAPAPLYRDETYQAIHRDKSLFDIYGTYGGYIPDPSNPLDIPDLSTFQYIGAFTEAKIASKRSGDGGTEIRYLSATEQDVIQEILPNLSSPEITLTGVVTYQQTLWERCGFGGFRARSQTRPMAFMFYLPSPNLAVIPASTYFVRGAVLQGNPLEFSVEHKDDLRIMQEVQIKAADLYRAGAQS
jgi:hypothetical protein